MNIDDIRDFISKHESIPLHKIHPNSDIVRQLGIDGDDGYELIQDIGRTFEVDLSSHDFYKCFGFFSVLNHKEAEKQKKNR